MIGDSLISKDQSQQIIVRLTPVTWKKRENTEKRGGDEARVHRQWLGGWSVRLKEQGRREKRERNKWKRGRDGQQLVEVGGAAQIEKKRGSGEALFGERNRKGIYITPNYLKILLT